MSPTPIKVLLIEDSPTDRLLVQNSLSTDPLAKFDLTLANRLAEGLHELARQRFDAVLLDLDLPDSQGLETFQRLRTLYPELPVVVLSGLADEEVAVQTVQNGAQDYIVKSVDSMAALARSVRYAVERQQAQLKLQASERTLKLFVEYAPAAIAMFDREMNYLAVSRRFLTDYRLADQDIVGRSHYDLFPEIPEHWKEIHRRCLAGASEKVEEAPFPRLDGTLDWIRWEIHPWYEPSGAIGGILLFSEVITERKRAEEALRRSEQKFATAFRISPDAININRLSDGLYLDVNEGFTAITGYSREDVIGRSSLELNIWADPAARNRLVQGLRESGEVTNLDTEFRMKDGTRRTGLMSARLIEVEGEVCILSMTRDISHRKQAEAALQMSEARLAGIIESAIDAIISVDEKQRIVLFNAAAERMFGCPAAEALGQPLERFIPERFHQVHREYIRAFEQGGASTKTMGRLNNITGRRANGEEFPLEASISQIEVAGAKLFTVIHRDVTEQKRAEIALRESEERFQLFMNNSPTTASIKDEQGRYIYVNQAYESRFGVQLADWRGKTAFEVWSPDVAEQIWQNDQSTLDKGHRMEFTQRIPNPDRSQSTWWTFKFPFRDASGRQYVGGIGLDITEREEFEAALYLTRFSVEHAADAIYWLDEEARVVEVNETACRTLGYSRDELLQLSFYDITPGLTPEAWQEGWQRLKQLRSHTAEGTHRTRTGQLIPVEVVANYIEFRGRSLNCAFVRDLSERKRAEEAQTKLEAQLHQAQKMESIGRLAGGVAHDFNNLLTVILGYSELMQSRLPLNGTALEQLEQIRLAAKRAEGLTRQLLAFSRKQMLVPEVFDLNELVTNLRKMLERLIGEDITLTTLLQPDLWWVKADPGQIEQVIMNLIVNARDAMPTGGRLTIETVNVSFEDHFTQTHSETLSGPGVRLTITDTGHGMDEETQAKIFEPFFTTKEQGQGTGLGLATVYGIIKQSGGEITISSQPGQGAAFSLYLPANNPTATGSAEPIPEPVAQPGRETILLVEDENVVRDFVRVALCDYGYSLLEVDHGYQALAVAQQEKSIDLLLTDVVMPDINGRELAERIKALHPQIKVLFMSGYTDDEILRRGIQMAEVEFMAKPFSPVVLAAKVREILDK